MSDREGGPASLYQNGMQSFAGMNVDSLCARLALHITAPVELAVASLLDHRLVRVVPDIVRHIRHTENMSEHDQSLDNVRRDQREPLINRCSVVNSEEQ